jgi:hypothetical protein
MCPQMVGVVPVQPPDVRIVPGSNGLHNAPGARSGAREPNSTLPLRGGRNQKSVRPWITASEGRRGDQSVSRSRRPMLPGVMSLRARWRRRRARAHLMNELLAAMDTPSRLDREDRVSAPRPVTRSTGSASGTNVRWSGTPTTPAAASYRPVDRKPVTTWHWA